jgi:hypothetical protein
VAGDALAEVLQAKKEGHGRGRDAARGAGPPLERCSRKAAAGVGPLPIEEVRGRGRMAAAAKGEGPLPGGASSPSLPGRFCVGIPSACMCGPGERIREQG